MSSYPYADRFEIHRSLPEVGLTRAEVLSQLHTMAKEEDVFWEGGKVSGTITFAEGAGANWPGGARPSPATRRPHQALLTDAGRVRP